MDAKRRSIRILMLPWLAHGHTSPFLQLAKSLAARNFFIYISSSPINLTSIRKKISEKDAVSIKLVDLYIPTSPQLPPHYHTTNGLPPQLMSSLKEAFDAARPAFSTLLKTLKPDLVLYDFLQPWVPEEAAMQNIPAVLFLSPGAAAFSYFMHDWLENSGSEYPFPAIFFRESESVKYSGMVNSSTNDKQRVRDCVKRSCDIVFIKTFREIEGKYIDFLSGLTGTKFVPVGPLVQNLDQMVNKDQEDVDNNLIQWLDGKDQESTIFASFGSEYFLNENEIEEIALGLELSRLNFIWVVRFPDVENQKEIKIEEVMPKGFLERVGERGMVVEGWAPQARILSHPSIGGFLSHCGWSSVMEGIYYGVPIIAMPMHLDQPLNARLVEEVGFGAEVVRSREGNVEREEVARVVRNVVVEENGRSLRQRVKELSEKVREKGGEEIDVVVEELVKLCKRYKRLNVSSPTNSIKEMNLVIMNREGACVE